MCSRSAPTCRVTPNGTSPGPYTTSTLVTITDAEGATGRGQFDSDSAGAFDLAPLLDGISRATGG